MKAEVTITLDANYIRELIKAKFKEEYRKEPKSITFTIDPGYEDKFNYVAASLSNAVIRFESDGTTLKI